MYTRLGSTGVAACALQAAVASKQTHAWFSDEGKVRRKDAENLQLYRIPWTLNITRSSRIREFPKDKPFSAPLIAVEQDTAPGRIYTQVRTTSSTTSEESRGSGRSALKLGLSSRPDPTSVEFRLPRRRPARQCPRRNSGERPIFVSQKPSSVPSVRRADLIDKASTTTKPSTSIRRYPSPDSSTSLKREVLRYSTHISPSLGHLQTKDISILISTSASSNLAV